MTLPEVRDRQEGFAAGLNTTSDEAALAPNEFRVAQNARLSTRGAVEKRGGTQFTTTNATAAAPVLGGVSWNKTTSVEQLFVCDGTLYTGGLGIPATWTDRGGTLSTTIYPTFAVFRGPSSDGVYIADGGALNFWDGTTLTENITNTPNVEAVAAWGPRLFGVSGDTLYWSSTTAGANGHTLGAAAGGGQAIVRTYGGQALVMPYPLKGSLLLFHRQAISRFTGATQDDINIEAGVQGISGDVGTVAKRSIIDVENVVYFLTDRGVFAATETSVQPVSSPLEKTLAGLGKSDWEAVSAVHARAFNELRWMIPNVGVYAYNYRTQGWTGPWDTAYADVTAMWDTTDSEGRPVVLLGREDGRVVWADRTGIWQDNVPAAGGAGTNYAWTVQCRRFFASDYTTFKAWRTLYFLGEFPDPANATIRVKTATNEIDTPMPFDAAVMGTAMAWGGTGTTWGTADSTWGAGTPAAVERERIPLHGVHPWTDVSFLYTGDDAAQLSIVDVMGLARGRR